MLRTSAFVISGTDSDHWWVLPNPTCEDSLRQEYLCDYSLFHDYASPFRAETLYRLSHWSQARPTSRPYFSIEYHRLRERRSPMSRRRAPFGADRQPRRLGMPWAEARRAAWGTPYHGLLPGGGWRTLPTGAEGERTHPRWAGEPSRDNVLSASSMRRRGLSSLRAIKHRLLRPLQRLSIDRIGVNQPRQPPRLRWCTGRHGAADLSS